MDFIYKGEAKVAKTLLSSFMEAANILIIDGLSDKDKVEKIKRNPVQLESMEEKKKNSAYREQLDIVDEINGSSLDM